MHKLNVYDNRDLSLRRNLMMFNTCTNGMCKIIGIYVSFYGEIE